MDVIIQMLISFTHFDSFMQSCLNASLPTYILAALARERFLLALVGRL